MNIHEHQAKELLRGFGVAVPKGIAAFTVDEAVSAAKKLGGDVTVVKAQIHAGGRGKAGGVKVVNSVAEVKTEAQRILGSTLVTHQTGPAGKEVKRLYIEEGCDIATELYLSMLVDRSSSQITIIASTEGGMDIEDVAHNTPELIHKINVDPNSGLLGFQKRDLGMSLGLSGNALKSFFKMLGKMYDMFISQDCAMVEINPLVRTEDDEIIALDSKISFDENAEF